MKTVNILKITMLLAVIGLTNISRADDICYATYIVDDFDEEGNVIGSHEEIGEVACEVRGPESTNPNAD